jgi:hypothetical protein
LKARTEKNTRIAVRKKEARYIPKIQKIEKKARIKQEKIASKGNRTKAKERTKLERDMLKRRKQAKEKKAKAEADLATRRVEAEEFTDLLIDSYETQRLSPTVRKLVGGWVYVGTRFHDFLLCWEFCRFANRKREPPVHQNQSRRSVRARYGNAGTVRILAKLRSIVAWKYLMSSTVR